ncbi:hypothetical protein J2Z43_000099 [Clostridioides mangenotii]|uniref:Uncharacterized protein n=1 Tax=Metaclostridioides mangenotii TaxID=1540 RepID=A0ABS4E6Z8_9FIRM|nr:hypothetical protein [Clostridioides mangenotii]
MNILPRVKSNGSLFGEPSNGEGGFLNINKYFYHARAMEVKLWLPRRKMKLLKQEKE